MFIWAVARQDAMQHADCVAVGCGVRARFRVRVRVRLAGWGSASGFPG